MVSRVAAPSRDVAGRVVVARPARGDVMLIDPIGVVVWRALDRPRTRDELVAVMTEAYPDAAGDTITDALDEIVDQLLDAGVIVRASEAGATAEVR